MVRSLWNAATGMNGQQMNIDTISNNLSNVNTTGFKQHRAEFEDLLYQNVKLAGTPATEDTVTPVGHQMGSGVKVGATQRIMTQGSLLATDSLGFSSMTEVGHTQETAHLRLIRLGSL